MKVHSVKTYANNFLLCWTKYNNKYLKESLGEGDNVIPVNTFQIKPICRFDL